MGIFGDLVKMGFDSFPKIPDAPDAPYVSPQIAQADSIAGNQAVLPSLQNIGRDINSYNLTERAKALNAGIPDYKRLTGANTSLLEDQLSGKIPDDVAAQVQRRSNSRAYAGGYGGSPAADNLFARDLGLTSMDIQARGQANLPPWLSLMGNLNVPPQFNVEGGFISPGQQIAAQQWNETNRFSQQWLQNQLDSIPDPETAAIANDVAGIADLIGTAALAWAGGAIGGMAGGAAGSTAGSQLGGMMGGGGGGGGMDIGSIVGSLMGGGGASAAPATSAATYPGAYYGYLPPSQQTVNPFGSNPSYPNTLGGYAYGAGGY